MNIQQFSTRTIIVALFVLCAGVVSYHAWAKQFTVVYDPALAKVADALKPAPEPPKPVHIATPKAVKSVYMSSWVAGTPSIRERLVTLADTTEVNAIVIDVKDYSGKVSFITGDPEIAKVGSEEERIRDLNAFIDRLHAKNIYVIARITVFQDPVYSKKYPSEAVGNKNGGIWKDRKGLSYIDPSSQAFWDYIVRISKASEQIGFDELNFDYIRYPSDGPMSLATYPKSGSPFVRAEKLEAFFVYLDNALKDTPVPLSADLFGLTTSAMDDLGIGQVLERALPHFDYVAPMVYPSHYSAGFQGFKNPADHPYEVVKYAMLEGVKKANAASSSPDKLRPWIQDFDLGADYGPTQIRAQIQATYDAGLNSWMSWDPGNKYTSGGYLKE